MLPRLVKQQDAIVQALASEEGNLLAPSTKVWIFSNKHLLHSRAIKYRAMWFPPIRHLWLPC